MEGVLGGRHMGLGRLLGEDMGVPVGNQVRVLSHRHRMRVVDGKDAVKMPRRQGYVTINLSML